MLPIAGRFVFILIFFWLWQPVGLAQSAAIQVLPIESPCMEGGESNLFVDDLGTVWLSWVEFVNDSVDALRVARLEGDTWTNSREIARGDNWFVNWADFPSLAVFSGTNGQVLAAHWLQKSAAGTFDYDIRMRLSQDGGATWDPPFTLNQDGIAAEHGFVSLAPTSDGQLRAVWLDGRHTKMDEEDADHAGHHGGAMTLRSALITPSGVLKEDIEIDSRVCDCCQTDLAYTSDGPIVVYRNRSEEEIRDIYVARQENGKWSEPFVLHPDKWLIAGCPVNGPAISTIGNNAAVGWFTGAGGKNKVQVSFSKNGGASFGKARRIDSGNPLGRVDIDWLSDQRAVVTWLEKTAEGARIQLRTIHRNGRKGAAHLLMETSAERASGFPIIARDSNGLLLSVTEVGAMKKTRVCTYRIILPLERN